MDSGQYLVESERTDTKDYDIVRARFCQPGVAELYHAIAGITTEAGELQDALKRYLIYGKPLDEVNLSEEAGDSMWYFSLLLRRLQKRFDDVFEQNIAKLRVRYPEKFSEEAALNRNLDSERKALEK